MKNKLITSFTFFFITLFSAQAAHLELVSVHEFDFINWALATQVVPLKDGGHVVQKYGRLLTLIDEKGNVVKEIEAGALRPLYQKGTQLRDGRLIFINDASDATIYDKNLNVVEEFKLPAEYVWAPCEAENGKMIFPTFRDDVVLIRDGKKITELAGVGERIRKASCLKDNRFMMINDSGLMTIADVSADEPKVLFQKAIGATEATMKVKGDKAYFLTGQGLVVFDLKTFSSEMFPNPELEEFSGVDYFTNGNYVTIEAFRNEAGYYDSKIILYSKLGKKLATDLMKRTGASIEMPVRIVDDKYIVTDFCSDLVVLYDQSLKELNRYEVKKWLCSDVLPTKNGFVFYGFDDFHYVYQFNFVR